MSDRWQVGGSVRTDYIVWGKDKSVCRCPDVGFIIYRVKCICMVFLESLNCDETAEEGSIYQWGWSGSMSGNHETNDYKISNERSELCFDFIFRCFNYTYAV